MNANRDINGKDQYSKQIRHTAVKALNTYANTDVKATASNGLDDFAPSAPYFIITTRSMRIPTGKEYVSHSNHHCHCRRKGQ